MSSDGGLIGGAMDIAKLLNGRTAPAISELRECFMETSSAARLCVYPEQRGYSKR